MHKPFYSLFTSLFIAIVLISLNFEPSFAIQENPSNTKLPPSPFRDSKQVGMIVSLKGIGIIKRSDGTKIMARTKIPIYEGDRVETGLGAFVQIEFVDQSKVSIQGSSDFTIKNYVYKSTKDVQYTAKMDNGLMSFMSGNIGKVAPQEFTIETVTATIGIRGTSGEILTADGTIPGRPKTMEVMKKGGIGISLTPTVIPSTGAVPSTPPKTLIVAESGKGFVVKGGEIEQVTFSTSPGEKYASQEKSRIKKAKAKKKKSTDEESAPEDDEKESTASQQSTEKEEDESSSEIVEEIDEEPESSEMAAVEDSTEVEESFLLSEDAADIEDPLLLETVFEEAPAVETDLGDLSTDLGDFSFDTFVVDIETELIEVPIEDTTIEYIAEIEDIQNSVETVLFNETVQSNEEELVEDIVESVSEGLASSISYSGNLSKNSSFENSDSSSSSDTLVTADPSSNILTISSPSGEDFFETSLPTSSETVYSNVLSDTLSSETEFFQRLYDNLNEFFIIYNTVSSADTIIEENLSYFGKESINSTVDDPQFIDGLLFDNQVEADIPLSGIRFYNSEFSLSNTSLSDYDKQSFLIKDGNSINEASSHSALVNFTREEVVGITFSKNFSNFFEEPYYSQNDSYNSVDDHFYESDFGDFLMGIPLTYYRGNLEADGSITDIHLYHNLGFSSPNDESTPHSFQNFPSFNDLLLNTFSGSGHLYGSQAQGIGINASDGSDGFFTAASFHDLNDYPIESTEGLYEGSLQGIHVYNSDLEFSHVKGNIDLSPYFSQSSLEGSLSFTEGNSSYTLDIQGYTMAVDHEILFGELGPSSTENSFSTLKDASFLASLDIPHIHFNAGLDITSDTSNEASDVMWGVWNVVRDESENTYYPGRQNYWTAAIPQSLDMEHDFLYYAGGNLYTVASSRREQQPFSEQGVQSFFFNKSTEEAIGLSFFPSGDLLVFKGEYDSQGFNGDLTALTSMGRNHSGHYLFSNNFEYELGSLKGSFASKEGKNLIFDYERIHLHDDEDLDVTEIMYGVGIATRIGENTSLSNQNYSGSLEGISIIDDTTFSVLEGGEQGADMDLSISAELNDSEYEIEVSIQVDDQHAGTSYNLSEQSSDINAFIHRHSFISSIQGSTSFGPSFSNESIDPINSYVVGLPGMDDFVYSSWGMWGVAAEESDPYTYRNSNQKRVFGYFALTSNTNSLEDINSLSSSSTPVYHYEGESIGTIFDNSDSSGYMYFGQASLDIDFRTGHLYGKIIYENDINIGLDGLYISDSLFEGSTSLNGSIKKYSFSANVASSEASEVVGSFSASDEITFVTGAFGAINTQQSPLETYLGEMKGVAIDNDDDSVALMESVGLSLGFDASNNQLFGTVAQTGESNTTFLTLSQNNSFISKDNFSSALYLVSPTNNIASLGDAFSSQAIDSSGSSFNTLSGLETFSFINWGIWQIQGSEKTAFGYFGAGKDSTPYINLPSIRDNSSSYNYSGASVATIYDSSNPTGFVDTGSANLVVDFSNGGVSGNIYLNSGPSIELLNGTISETSNGLPFSGNTQLNNVETTNGFSGHFYGDFAQESSGTFHAQDSVQKITGAFGVGQSSSIPQQD